MIWLLREEGMGQEERERDPQGCVNEEGPEPMEMNVKVGTGPQGSIQPCPTPLRLSAEPEPGLRKDLRSPSLLSKILSSELQSIPNLPGETEFEAAK